MEALPRRRDHGPVIAPHHRVRRRIAVDLLADPVRLRTQQPGLRPGEQAALDEQAQNFGVDVAGFVQGKAEPQAPLQPVGVPVAALAGVDVVEPALVAIISAAILLLTHSKNTKFSDLKNDISWRIIIIFAILFILANSLSRYGFSELIATGLVDLVNNNIYLAVLITLCLSTLLSAFLAGTPVTIILLPIFSAFIGQGFFPNPIIIAFIGGVNLAGNFLPQGSACDLLTLSLAKKYKVENLDYKRLLKNGAFFAMIHFFIILGYTMLYTLVLS